MSKPARGETAKSVSLPKGQALKGRTPKEDRQLGPSKIGFSMYGLFRRVNTLNAGPSGKPGPNRSGHCRKINVMRG